MNTTDSPAEVFDSRSAAPPPRTIPHGKRATVDHPQLHVAPRACVSLSSFNVAQEYLELGHEVLGALGRDAGEDEARRDDTFDAQKRILQLVRLGLVKVVHVHDVVRDLASGGVELLRDVDSKSIWFRREKIRPNKGRARTPRQWGRPTCRW